MVTTGGIVGGGTGGGGNVGGGGKTCDGAALPEMLAGVGELAAWPVAGLSLSGMSRCHQPT
jgi:hypothetical protein